MQYKIRFTNPNAIDDRDYVQRCTIVANSEQEARDIMGDVDVIDVEVLPTKDTDEQEAEQAEIRRVLDRLEDEPADDNYPMAMGR